MAVSSLHNEMRKVVREASAAGSGGWKQTAFQGELLQKKIKEETVIGCKISRPVIQYSSFFSVLSGDIARRPEVHVEPGRQQAPFRKQHSLRAVVSYPQHRLDHLHVALGGVECDQIRQRSPPVGPVLGRHVNIRARQ